jgi:hypothetical protein
MPQFVAAAVAAVVAFGLALLADAGSPVSHGGQAVEQVRRGGIGRAFDFVRIRLRLNFDSIRDFPLGYVLFAGLVVLAVALFWWGRSVESPPVRPRVAAVAGAAMALCALFLEDSGFYVGTLLVHATLVAWLLSIARPGGPVTAARSDAPAAGG